MRKAFEGICLALLATMWLGHLDLANEIRNNPVSHLMVPLWALIAYPCASFGPRDTGSPILPKNRGESSEHSSGRRRSLWR